MVNHLISEPAKLTGCPRCGEYTITAVSGGISVRADPGPLPSASQEIAALIAGKRTCDLIPFGLHYYLEWRDASRIKAGRSYPVVATHKCQRASAAPQPKPDLELLTVRAAPLPDDPPF